MYCVQYAGACHKGRVRRTNQDNIVYKGHWLREGTGETVKLITGCGKLHRDELFGVFDGMGGEQRGEAASRIAAETAAEWYSFRQSGSLVGLCRKINRRICEYTRTSRLKTCGTTASMLLLEDSGVMGCNIGDSRIYHYHNDELIQMSEDHVLPGFGLKKPPLLQYLGIPEDEMFIEPSAFYREYTGNDIYLLCTDGLTDMLPEKTIRSQLRSADPLDMKAEQLLRSALSSGGKDNISFFLISIRKDRE